MAIHIMRRHQTEATVTEKTRKERAWLVFRGLKISTHVQMCSGIGLEVACH